MSLQNAFAERGTELLPLGGEQAGDDQSDLRVLAARLSQPASPGTPAELLPRQTTVRRLRLPVPDTRQPRVGPDGVALPLTAAWTVETNASLLSRRESSRVFNPLTPTVAIWLYIKHPVPDQVKPSFVIFDILAL